MVEIPYKPFYAYEETLAVFGDPPTQPDSLLAAYERLAHELVSEHSAASLAVPAPQPATTRFKPILTRAPTTAHRRSVFISYVREDYETVDRIADALRLSGIDVWLDRTNLAPGDRWINHIRNAIEDGDFFLACFSPAYEARKRTYMNEELRLAVELLRQHPRDRRWFIPAKLDPCHLPRFAIGPGETLDHLQHVDFATDWNQALAQLLSALRTANPTTSSLTWQPHLNSRNTPDHAEPAEAVRLGWLAEYQTYGATRRGNIE